MACRVPLAIGRVAPFGPMSATALLAGVTCGLLLPGLPPTAWLIALLVAGLALLLRGDGWRLAGALLFGVGFAGLHADHVLRGQLPASLERRALEIEGRIVELPVHEPRRTRFEFVVDDHASQPDALRGKRIRLGWFEEDPRGRARLQAGSRWGFPVELRAPTGLRNPGASDGEKHALASRIAATGHVMEPVLARRLASPGGIAAWRERMSGRIAASVPSASSRYVRALALGDTRALDETDWSRRRAAVWRRTSPRRRRPVPPLRPTAPTRHRCSTSRSARPPPRRRRRCLTLPGRAGRSPSGRRPAPAPP